MKPLALALLVTLWATAASAQAIPSLRSPLLAVPAGGTVSSWDCDLPPVPNAPPQWIDVRPGALVEWCLESATLDQAKTAAWQLAVDGGPQVLLAVACRAHPTAPTPILCYAMLPPGAVSVLAQQGIHTLDLATTSIAQGLAVSVKLERPWCLADGTRYDVGAVLPNTAASLAAGSLYSTAGAYNVETRIGRLRQDGWHVEWTREQWAKVPTTTTQQSLDPGGAFWLFGWCRGVPQ